MLEGVAAPATSTVPRATRLRKLLWLALMLAVGMVLTFTFWIRLSKPSGPLARMELADGRILQIEGVTYGTEHRIGHNSILVERLGPWMPGKLRDWLTPKFPENRIKLEQPALVVWVNAINPETGTNVDCQSIRTEFVEKHGDLFGQETSSWFGGQKFWRVGHIFCSYPRDEMRLTFRVTPWKKGKNTPVTVQFANPHVVTPANWTGEPLPQTKTVSGLQITLARLNMRTNEQKYWQTPSKYFEPVFELRQNGQPASGWSEPEWTTEDPTGNRGECVGLHYAALRFRATVYPTTTNADAALPVGTLPPVDLGVLTNQTLWNSRIRVGTNELVALGICPPGVYTFTGGAFDPTGPRMTAVGGGAPSGWTSQTKRVTPMKLQTWHGHYTPAPTIYIRATQLKDPDRLALRLRDDSGRTWTAKPEPQGCPDGVHAFLLELPSEITNIVPELVLLQPVEADFMVETKSAPKP